VLAGTAAAQRYVVVYKAASPPALASLHLKRAGGELVAAYQAIGVVVAESSNPGFEAAMERLPQVVGATATAEYAAPSGSAYSKGGKLPDEPVAGTDRFSSLQWGLDQIRAREAHAVTGGSPGVLVGLIDTGIDAAHADLDDNLDAAASVSCVGGAPNTNAAAWDDDSGHGTLMAGIVAAEANGIGTVGVAPNVRIAAIKASLRVGASDFFLPEAVVCAYMWAATNGIDVANSSFSVDGALVSGATSFCGANREHATIVEAVRRAVEHARFRGVSVVASAGNSGLEVAGSECLRLPSQLPGVLTVAATGILGQRTAYSNYGLGFIDLAAPGGEVAQGGPPPGNLILSTWPARFPASTLLCEPAGIPCFPGPTPGVSYYRYGFGTSQATAHVSGVAALVVSRVGRPNPSFRGQASPDRVAAILTATAAPRSCPPNPACQGDAELNGFYGHGIVDALAAVQAAR